VEHERVCISAELRHDEGHAVGHQAGDAGYIAREPVKLGNDDGALLLAGRFERLRQGSAAIESIGALASLYLDELALDGDPFRFREAGDCRSLSLDA
jgi:hypothetical protein